MTINSQSSQTPNSAGFGSKQLSQRINALMNPKVRLIGDGPCEASSSHVLDKPLCWDMNGFYRRLGVPTTATKAEIRQAYLDLDGSSSSRLTKAVEVLTNRRTRMLYDSTPFGWFWPDDEALVEMMISQNFETSTQADEEGWAFYIDVGGQWQFEVYGADDATDRLDEWRAHVGLALWMMGITDRFAMGVSDVPSVVQLGRRIVCFVTLTSKASSEYAAKVAVIAAQLLQERKVTIIPTFPN